jgi:hypothetical protein
VRYVSESGAISSLIGESSRLFQFKSLWLCWLCAPSNPATQNGRPSM